MALITHRIDPYYFYIPDGPLTLIFRNYGNPLELTDALRAVETASLQAWSMKPAKLVGTRPRTYKYGTAEFHIEPQARLNWKTYLTVTFGIMKVLQDKLYRETGFSIVGNDYEGYLGWGSVYNID